MNEFDVVIVGSGPAGGECARRLAMQDLKVFLADRIHDFSVNSYSSGGAPNEILAQFQLPGDVIASQWDKFHVYSSKKKAVFKADTPRGVVMDFTKLRAFLAHDAEKHGCKVSLGTTYRSHELTDNGVTVTFKMDDQQEKTVYTKILVDATGSDRLVLDKPEPSHLFKATGIEYLVKVPEDMYDQWAGTLSFFMGHHWMPQGYSWIFPVERGRLKVGVGRYFPDEQVVPHKQSFEHYLTHMMRECLGSDQLPIVDRHGKQLRYAYHHNVQHYCGPVIGIGDSVSTLNPLALEGIRHAMESAHIASEEIVMKLKQPRYSFKSYQKRLGRYYGYKWLISEWLVYFIYRSPNDEAIDEMVEAYSGLSFDELYELGFHYKLRCALKFLYRWGKIKIKKRLGIRHKTG